MDEIQQERKYLKILYWVTVVYGLIIIALYVIFINTFNFTKKIEPIPFEEMVWKQDGEKEHGIPKKRMSMVKDVIEKRLYQGMVKEEVISILGSPDENHDWDKAKTVYIYYLGQNESIIGISFLHIHFDEKNKLIDTNITND